MTTPTYIVPQDGLKPAEQITSGGHAMRYQPEWAPDGKRIAFGDKDGIYLADTRAVAPWVRVIYPRKARDRVTRDAVYTISGTAEDDTGVAKVEYTVQREKNGRQRLQATGKARQEKHFKAKSEPKLAKGDRNWKFLVPLSVGDNRIEVTATDRLGNVSEPLVLVIRRY